MIYIDFDGTIASYYWNGTYEDYVDNICRLQPTPFLSVVKMLMLHSDICICSKVRTPEEEEKKKEWLHRYLPELPLTESTCLFVYGKDKGMAISNLRKNDILIDDFTTNLKKWPGIPVKYLNGINSSKGSWIRKNGLVISANMNPLLVTMGLLRLQNKKF